MGLAMVKRCLVLGRGESRAEQRVNAGERARTDGTPDDGRCTRHARKSGAGQRAGRKGRSIGMPRGHARRRSLVFVSFARRIGAHRQTGCLVAVALLVESFAILKETCNGL